MKLAGELFRQGNFSQQDGSPKPWALRNFYEGPSHLTASQELIPLAGRREQRTWDRAFYFCFTFPPNFRPVKLRGGLNFVGRHKFI